LLDPLYSRYEKVPTDPSAGIWDGGNKTLLIEREASTMDLENREFACRTEENGNYEQFSTAQVMALACKLEISWRSHHPSFNHNYQSSEISQF